MAQFDPKNVTSLEWAGIGAGGLAFIFSFFPWFSADGPGVDAIAEMAGEDASLSAWSVGFAGWFSVLLLVAAAVVVLLPRIGTQVPNRTMIWLSTSAAAVVLILLRWVTYDDLPDEAEAAGYSAGASFGTYLTLIAAIVSVVAAVMTQRSAPKPAA